MDKVEHFRYILLFEFNHGSIAAGAEKAIFAVYRTIVGNGSDSSGDNYLTYLIIHVHERI